MVEKRNNMNKETIVLVCTILVESDPVRIIQNEWAVPLLAVPLTPLGNWPPARDRPPPTMGGGPRRRDEGRRAPAHCRGPSPEDGPGACTTSDVVRTVHSSLQPDRRNASSITRRTNTTFGCSWCLGRSRRTAASGR